MTARQQYWQHLRAIHDITGVWIRRVSFTAARDMAFALQDMITTGYDAEKALERSYDALAVNKRGTWMPRGELLGLSWNY